MGAEGLLLALFGVVFAAAGVVFFVVERVTLVGAVSFVAARTFVALDGAAFFVVERAPWVL